jgi:hypothetical protein
VAFATAHQWVLRLGAAKRALRLEEELERLGRTPLVIVDEVGNTAMTGTLEGRIARTVEPAPGFTARLEAQPVWARIGRVDWAAR